MPLITTTFAAPKALADMLLALTETQPEISLDVGEHADDALFTYTLWLPTALQAFVVQALAGVNSGLVFAEVDETTDYVAQTLANFPPLAVGPYYITRNDETVPPGLIELRISPNRAFGSGEHATTTGCLLAYEWLVNQGLRYQHGLDFGAGSGILAIAAAKRQATPCLAIDNDPPSVAICAENAALNDVAALIPCAVGETPTGDAYDLIFANILLHPLLELSHQLVQALGHQPGASLILSGFTTEQGPELAARYQSLGLQQVWQHAQAGWLAQVWQRG